MKMTEWDPVHKQLLSSQCKQCPDSYFAPYQDGLPHVGCCSHSPTFGLFELYKMVKSGDRLFFWEQIYQHERSTVQELTITVHAYVDPLFHRVAKKQSLLPYEWEDTKLSFSVCSFFVHGTGCGLPPAYKNKVCRAFICSSIEDGLDDQQRADFVQRAREIREEVELFEKEHEAQMKRKGWTFQKNMASILDYLEGIEEKKERN